MHSDYDGELHALRDIIAAMSGVVRTVGLAANINIDSLELAMTRWHKWRTERWGREVKDAEKVLQKASTISDYGIVDGTDKFVTQADVKELQRALQNALCDAKARRKKGGGKSKSPIPCKGIQTPGVYGNDYDCNYTHAGSIACESCIVNGGEYDPRTGKKYYKRKARR